MPSKKIIKERFKNWQRSERIISEFIETRCLFPPFAACSADGDGVAEFEEQNSGVVDVGGEQISLWPKVPYRNDGRRDCTFHHLRISFA